MKSIKPLFELSINRFSTETFIKVFFFLLLLLLLITQNTQHMGDRFFWLDEALSYFVAKMPFWEILNGASIKHLQPPLFYWLGHFAAQIGTDPFTLRSVSLACYVLMLGFVIFSLRELLLPTRVLLCLVLILTPFAAFATTEFRPYALAAFSILTSSVFLYRSLQQPSSWSQALCYGLFALLLQYSLTLNSFVFGIQMLFLYSNIVAYSLKNGFYSSLKCYKPLINITLLLIFLYSIFLYTVVEHNSGYYLGRFPASLLDKLFSNSEGLLMTLTLASWERYLVFACFTVGIGVGLIKQRSITLYLLIVLFGQFIFSTYMTYSRLPWFSPRYLVASYIAFALLCGLGADYIFRKIDKKISLLLIALIMLHPIHVATGNFKTSLKTKNATPLIAAIDSLQCDDLETVLLTDPSFIRGSIKYAYRDDPSLQFTHPRKIRGNLKGLNKCIIIWELQRRSDSKEPVIDELLAHPNYENQYYRIKGGKHQNGTLWLFTPKEE